MGQNFEVKVPNSDRVASYGIMALPYPSLYPMANFLRLWVLTRWNTNFICTKRVGILRLKSLNRIFSVESFLFLAKSYETFPFEVHGNILAFSSYGPVILSKYEFMHAEITDIKGNR